MPYQGGYLALTETHLVVVQRDGSPSIWLSPTWVRRCAEQAHSFRHRGSEIVCGACCGSVGSRSARRRQQSRGLGAFQGQAGFAALFGAFFGLLFLGGVLHSRRIWSLRVRYGDAVKNIPLPGVDENELEEFLKALRDREETCAPRSRDAVRDF